MSRFSALNTRHPLAGALIAAVLGAPLACAKGADVGAPPDLSGGAGGAGGRGGSATGGTAGASGDGGASGSAATGGSNATGGTAGTSATGGAAGSSSTGGTAGTGAAGGAAGSDGGGPRPTPTLGDHSLVCKLINDTTEGDATANQAPTRANLSATDLGIPVQVGGTLFFMFGDTWGNRGIWQLGESLPDAVGYSLDSAAALASNPSLLCSDLRFLTLAPAASLGPTLDPSILADFAATAMIAPDGQAISTYVHNPSGSAALPFPQLPGTFEVPSGAFAHGGALYVTYTTVGSASDLTMKGSYLAKWPAPTTHDPPNFNVLYRLDHRFDATGPLHGDFVNVATEVSGAYVYLFGTGDYRTSPVRLGRKALASLDTPGGVELYDAATDSWGTARGSPVITAPGYGETSVRYFAAIDRWMFLAEDLSSGDRVVARFAERPEGPWTDPPLVIHDNSQLTSSPYCCGTTCSTAQQIIHCGSAGLYGAYLLPEVKVGPSGTFTVLYTLSTWDPYNVVLMQATFTG